MQLLTFRVRCKFLLSMIESCENRVQLRVNVTGNCPNSIDVHDKHLRCTVGLEYCICTCMLSAMKPMNRLQIRSIVHNKGAHVPLYSPYIHTGLCSSVGMRHSRDRQTDTQTAVTNIHFASAMPHAKL